jgi:hypothetical protein
MIAPRALATNATTPPTSSGLSKRFRSELGRTFSKNSFSRRYESHCRPQELLCAQAAGG